MALRGVPLPAPVATPLHRVDLQRTPADPPEHLPEHAVAATTAPPPRPVVGTTVPTPVQRETRDVVPMPLPPAPAPAPTTLPVQAVPTDDGPPSVTDPEPPAPDRVGPTPVVSRAGEPAATPGTAPGPGGAAPGGATDVEALAQRLFQPILRRMKAELLLDRERRGLRTDAW
jgi:hypothetical protein